MYKFSFQKKNGKKKHLYVDEFMFMKCFLALYIYIKKKISKEHVLTKK